MRFIFIFLVSLMIIPDTWKLEKSSGEVKAYTANIGKPFKKIKVNCPVNLSNTKAFDKYFEVAKHSTWMPEILKSELLKVENENTWYTRYEVKFPFPFKNRELVYKMTKTTTDKEITVNYTSVPNYIPANKNFERMVISEGYWKFTKVTATTCIVETGAYNETAGIPAWLVNMFIIDVPLNTMVSCKKYFESSKN